MRILYVSFKSYDLNKTYSNERYYKKKLMISFDTYAIHYITIYILKLAASSTKSIIGGASI